MDDVMGGERRFTVWRFALPEFTVASMVRATDGIGNRHTPHHRKHGSYGASLDPFQVIFGVFAPIPTLSVVIPKLFV